MEYSNLKLIFFDLDLTLAESKSAITPKMAALLIRLLEQYQICVISGGKFEQFEKQLVGNLNIGDDLAAKLHLMPTQGALYYAYEGARWKKKHEFGFTPEEKRIILNAFNDLIKSEPSLQIETFGEQIEDRGGQITFSALGQQAPSGAKHSWDRDKKKRMELRKKLLVKLPNFKISLGGSTSIDITQAHIDKAFGVSKLGEILKINPKNEALYIGDDLQGGGNDYEALKTGITGIHTSGPEETEKIIRTILDKDDISIYKVM
jgi:HAD superfamily hydrolase (TIGR01484 family)